MCPYSVCLIDHLYKSTSICTIFRRFILRQISCSLTQSQEGQPSQKRWRTAFSTTVFAATGRHLARLTAVKPVGSRTWKPRLVALHQRPWAVPQPTKLLPRLWRPQLGALQMVASTFRQPSTSPSTVALLHPQPPRLDPARGSRQHLLGSKMFPPPLESCLLQPRGTRSRTRLFPLKPRPTCKATQTTSTRSGTGGAGELRLKL